MGLGHALGIGHIDADPQHLGGSNEHPDPALPDSLKHDVLLVISFLFHNSDLLGRYIFLDKLIPDMLLGINGAELCIRPVLWAFGFPVASTFGYLILGIDFFHRFPEYSL